MTKSVKLAIAGAALAGMVAGTSASLCAQDAGTASTDKAAKKASKHTKDKHACKGQNSCKGKGGCKVSDNGCKGKNSCKGKGGCRTDGKPMDSSAQ